MFGRAMKSWTMVLAGLAAVAAVGVGCGPAPKSTQTSPRSSEGDADVGKSSSDEKSPRSENESETEASLVLQAPSKIDPFKGQIEIHIYGSGSAVPDFGNRLRCDYHGENVTMKAKIGGRWEEVEEAEYGVLVFPSVITRVITVKSSPTQVFQVSMKEGNAQYLFLPDPCDYDASTTPTADDCPDRGFPSAFFGVATDISQDGTNSRLFVKKLGENSWRPADSGSWLQLNPPEDPVCP